MAEQKHRSAPKKRKPKPPTGRLLFEPVKLASRYSDEVVVSFSGGKDSAQEILRPGIWRAGQHALGHTLRPARRV